MTTHKELQPKLAKVVKILNSRPLAWVTTLDLVEKGIMNPAAAICALKKLGAHIETIRADAKTSSGNVYPRVAHYRFVGWVCDE